ncbi:uncharacterized protein LOC124143678 [Haliotis rufescens]|uniref:uncharacterized protein LOC124143678 n=1 Tax=Haliotis rufescens TaxID=6454 RepID=UPI00201F4AD7|nr:uncharacterized protein LOC124143678 [Haliotis rufescens]
MKIICLCIALFGAAANAQSTTHAYNNVNQFSFPPMNSHHSQGNTVSTAYGYHGNSMSTNNGNQAQAPAPAYPTMNTNAYPMSNNYASQANDYNGYQSNVASTQNGYQSNTNNINSYMLPMMMGMDQGRHMATLGMMMNSRQGNNMLPFYMMNQGYENMLPMMAFMNRGTQRGQRMNPFMMMTLHEAMN